MSPHRPGAAPRPPLCSRCPLPVPPCAHLVWTRCSPPPPGAVTARSEQLRILFGGPGRRGAGSIPASCRICHTVEAAIGWPSLASSPCTRRCPHAGVICCHTDHERADRSRRGRSSGTSAVRVIPLACDKPPVPGQERRRGQSEHLAPPAPGDQPGQRREPQPVTRLVAEPADLAAQHRVLVPEHQEFGILGYLTPGQHHQAVKQAAH
jgi:hypothetical protein